MPAGEQTIVIELVLVLETRYACKGSENVRRKQVKSTFTTNTLCSFKWLFALIKELPRETWQAKHTRCQMNILETNGHKFDGRIRF